MNYTVLDFSAMEAVHSMQMKNQHCKAQEHCAMRYVDVFEVQWRQVHVVPHRVFKTKSPSLYCSYLRKSLATI